MGKARYCNECGLEFRIDSNGIAKHFDDYGDHDWEADADHVPFDLDFETN